MVISGAGGHAREVADILYHNGYREKIYFFDNINKDISDKIFNEIIVLKNEVELMAVFSDNSNFVIGVGGPYKRKYIAEYFSLLGGNMKSICAQSAYISKYGVYRQWDKCYEQCCYL